MGQGERGKAVMNTATDFLQGIHERLAGLPNDLASILSSPRGADLDDVEFPNVPTPGVSEASDSPSISQTAASESPFPEMPSFGAPEASFPEMPVLGSADVSDSPFPSVSAPSSIEASFPTAPSFAGAPGEGNGPVGSSFDKDDIMIGHLAEMEKALTNLTRTGAGQNGFQRSSGPKEVRGPSFYVADMDNDEGFSQGSPSVNASSTAGLRGAGGHGFGSRYSRQASTLHGGGPSRGGQDQFLEGGR